jgi:predicted protein tyrosine phosphatase
MSTYRSVEFVSRSEAGARDGDANAIVISINDTMFPVQKLEAGWKDVLVLQFDPIDSLLRGSAMKRFTAEQAEQILDFAHKHANTATAILVHCSKGEQRSAAVAKVLAQLYGLPFPEDYDKCHGWVLKVLNQIIRNRANQARKQTT